MTKTCGKEMNRAGSVRLRLADAPLAQTLIDKLPINY
jgi:hypothetical protein